MRKPTPYAHAMAWQVCRLLKMISSVCMALDMFSGGKNRKVSTSFGCWILFAHSETRSHPTDNRQAVELRFKL